jgi:predicted amidophosphoribosyltransferase
MVQDSSTVTGKHILLVDDVITTGSTMESCVNELLKSDGVRVSVAALAVSLV